MRVPSPAAGREGLPSTFRMRATSHYVDSLWWSWPAVGSRPPIAIKLDITGARPAGQTPVPPRQVDRVVACGRRAAPACQAPQGACPNPSPVRKRLAAAAAVWFTEGPRLLRDADDDRARALAEADNRGAGAAAPGEPAVVAPSGVPARAARDDHRQPGDDESCLNLFLDRDRPLRERVAASLVRVEAHRARWLAEAYSLLGADPKVSKKGINPVSLIGRVLQGLEAEGRLSNAKLALTIDEPTRALAADERLMSVALTGAAGAMLGLLQGVGDAVLRIRVSTHPPRGCWRFSSARTWWRRPRRGWQTRAAAWAARLARRPRRVAGPCRGQAGRGPPAGRWRSGLVRGEGHPSRSAPRGG